MSDAQKLALHEELREAQDLRSTPPPAPVPRKCFSPTKSTKKRKSADEGIAAQDSLPSPSKKRQRRSLGITMRGFPTLDKALKELEDY